MTSLYLYAIAKLNIISITHKFLVVGHTQNEGDSAHSVIEKQIKKSLKSGPIYIPSQYVTLIQIAKKTGTPFTVEQLSSDDIYDIKDISKNIGDNYTLNTNGEKVYWNNIRIVKVEKCHPGIIFYKNTYENDEFMKINVNMKKKGRRSSGIPYNIKLAYAEKPKITENKKRDLLSLCDSNHIPKVYHSFYKNL